MSDPLDATDDPELVRRSLAGETGAFGQLVERHQRLVFGVAFGGARDATLAEEIAQEAFLEAWRELPRLREPNRVGSWIAGIARNLARSGSRRAARRRRHADALKAEAQAGPVSATPLDQTLEHESRTRLRRALDDIPAAYREVLVLYYVHGRSAADVAAALGISDDLVKQRLLRGRRALRSHLERDLEDALGQVGPSKAFTTTVTLAVASAAARNATAATSATSAGKVLTVMSSHKVIVAAAAVALVGGGVFYGLSRTTHAAPSSPAPAALATATANTTSTTVASGSGSATRGARRLENAAERERILQSIRESQARRAARSQTSASPPPGGASPTNEDGDLDKDYVRSAVQELIPFITECYERLMDKDPNAAGNVIVNFTIEGDTDTGGLVTSSEIDKTSELTEPDFQECIRQTMFALEIEPPSNGQPVKVTYPFTFRRTDPEE